MRDTGLRQLRRFLLIPDYVQTKIRRERCKCTTSVQVCDESTQIDTSNNLNKMILCTATRR